MSVLSDVFKEFSSIRIYRYSRIYNLTFFSMKSICGYKCALLGKPTKPFALQEIDMYYMKPYNTGSHYPIVNISIYIDLYKSSQLISTARLE